MTKLETLCTVRGGKMVNRTGVPRISKDRTTIQPSTPTSRYLLIKVEIRISKRYLQSHIYCSIIHNSQEIGKNLNVHQQMST